MAYGRNPTPMKCINAAMNHRRGDKYLFANAREYKVRSYRDLWRYSGVNEPFEVWLEKRNIKTGLH